MRRNKNASGISPKQLKHFAVAATAITGLLALFASGENWGAKAQIEAAEAKNRAKMAEIKNMGDKRDNLLAVRKAPAAATFGDAAGVGPGGGDAAGGSAAAAPPPFATRTFADGPPVQMAFDGKQMVEVATPDAKAKQPPRPTRPNAEQTARMRAMSRQRSGA